MKILKPLAILGCLIVTVPSHAQTANPATATAAPAAAAAQLTPEQARQAIDTLQNDAKRSEIINALRAIANTSSASGAQQATPPQNDPPTALPADSLGAQLLLRLSEQVDETSRQIADAARAVTHFPALWRWAVRTANDPWTFNLLLNIAWKLAVVLICAFAVEWLVRAAMKKPLAALERNAPAPANAPSQMPPPDRTPSDDAVSAAEAETSRRKLTRLWQSLKRLPFVLARLVIDLLPVAAFLVTAAILIGTNLVDPGTTQLVILAIVNAYALNRVLVSVVRTIASSSRLSLFPVREQTGAYIEIWARRIATIGVFGIALANVALLLGLYRGAYHALIRLVMLAVHLLVVVVILQCRRPVARAIRAANDNNNAFAAIRNRTANWWHYLAVAVVMALWVVWAMNVRNGYALLLQYLLGTIAVIAITRLVSIVALGAMDKVFKIKPEMAARFPGLELSANRYLPVVRRTISGIIAVIGFVAMLEVWGVDAMVWFYGGQIGNRLLSAIGTIGVATLAAIAVWEISNALMDRKIAQLTRDGHHMRVARLRTFLPMLRTTLLCVIVAVVGLTALSEIGVNVAPLLAGAGILGIAIGFGSQKLVQDVITGLFLLIENVVQVGDTVTVSGLTGKVENLSIRTIRLRAGDGSIHIVPFSAVTSVTNASRGVGNAAVHVDVAFGEDTDHVGQMLKDIVSEMRQEPKFSHLIRSDLDLWGVDKIDGTMASLVGQIPCTDAGRWPVQREFNRRVKQRFQQHGIEIASPNQTLVIQSANPAEVEPPDVTRRSARA
ncbi:small-conductance mechanosensitive channel [Afipia sp. Root123D2]|uniref:mechanosensitive ion channel domain-containing protein n=1 Tax=Afipia sp. Root123D2 TaxID=1736436 RepID=UPI0006F4E3B4|nr:mechanosensitive ion channel domain-containing protein [Afipia sp. Root123D2]KQW19121.1 small-conductance mechanosensitive channel [Afipia sp. Root123D2]